MPTYEYVCKQCGENFDIFQSFSDKPLKKHDVCGGELQKVFHARGIVFKGSGFYATGNRAGGSGEPKTDPAKKKTDSSSTKKSDTKPSSKTRTASKTTKS